MQRSAGVSGMACRAGWSSEAWETRNASLSRQGNHTNRRGMRIAGVGAVRSSHDGGDSITPPERRGRTSTTRLRRTKAGQVLNKEDSKVIEHPTVGSWILREVARA